MISVGHVLVAIPSRLHSFSLTKPTNEILVEACLSQRTRTAQGYPCPKIDTQCIYPTICCVKLAPFRAAKLNDNSSACVVVVIPCERRERSDKIRFRRPCTLDGRAGPKGKQDSGAALSLSLSLSPSLPPSLSVVLSPRSFEDSKRN